jgi:hypothetical protein
MKWFDPISQRWQDPPRHSAAPLTYAGQQVVQRLEMEETARRESASRIWDALQASAASTLMSAPPVREIEIIEDAALDPQVLYGEWRQLWPANESD